MKKLLKVSVVAMMALATQSYAAGELAPHAELKSPTRAVTTLSTTPWYAGAGLVGAKVSSSNCEDITYGVMLKSGYVVNEYLSVEARALKTNWEYEGAKVEHIGAFLKPTYAVDKETNIYALAGYAKTSFGNRKDFSDTGFAYGLGVDYDLTKELSLFVDYENLLSDAGVYDINAFTFGVDFKF